AEPATRNAECLRGAAGLQGKKSRVQQQPSLSRAVRRRGKCLRCLRVLQAKEVPVEGVCGFPLPSPLEDCLALQKIPCWRRKGAPRNHLFRLRETAASKACEDCNCADARASPGGGKRLETEAGHRIVVTAHAAHLERPFQEPEEVVLGRGQAFHSFKEVPGSGKSAGGNRGV